MDLKLSDKEDRWRCPQKKCRKQKQLKSGSWLHGTHLSYRQVILFLYCWANKYTSIKFAEKELDIKHCATVDWNNYLREVCAQFLLANPKKIGGKGYTVEIDESLFVRRKHNKGRDVGQQWVFGGICRETGDCFLFAVDTRSKEQLLPIIESSILPESKIISDEWKAYKDISKLGYEHQTVKHCENFVDPSTGACTNMVEGMWNLAKSENKKRWGTHRTLIDSYLCEFMWRRTKGNECDLFIEIIKDIVAYNPLSN